MRLTMPVRSSWARLLLAALAVLAVACSERGATLPNAPATTVAATAAGALPDGCAGDAPSPTAAPVAFVAEGRAWATTADGLPPVVPVRGAPAGTVPVGAAGRPGGAGRAGGARGRGPGVAAGPRDRDRLAGLAGRQRERARLRHAGRPQPGLGRPRLDRPARAHPVPGRPTYQAVAGHPSGEALAFVLRREGASEIWMASNAGSGAVRLVGPTRARLGPLAFAAGGKALYYGGQAAGRQPPARGLLAGRGPPPGPGLDGRAGHPGRRRPARPGRHPARRRHRQRLRRPPGRPVGAGRRAGPAAAAVGVPADQRRRLARHPPGAGGRGRLRGAVRPVAGGRERRRAEAGGPRDRPGGAALARPPARPRPPDLAALGRAGRG